MERDKENLLGTVRRDWRCLENDSYWESVNIFKSYSQGRARNLVGEAEMILTKQLWWLSFLRRKNWYFDCSNPEAWLFQAKQFRT